MILFDLVVEVLSLADANQLQRLPRPILQTVLCVTSDDRFPAHITIIDWSKGLPLNKLRSPETEVSSWQPVGTEGFEVQLLRVHAVNEPFFHFLAESVIVDTHD